MNSSPVGIDLSSQSWTRPVRRFAIITALALNIAAAWAQNAVSTIAGSVGSPGYTNATGTAAQFRFTNPSGVAVDSAGNIFVADAVNNAIRRIATDGAVTTFAGSATGVAGNADGTGTGAFFSSPQGLAIDGANNLYVADTGNHAIRRITPGGVVTTLAGTAGPGATVASGNVNNATGTNARFNQPLGVAADRAGAGGAAVNVYVADTQNNAIRQIVVASTAVTTLAGSTTGASGTTNGTNTDARFNHPDGIVSDAAGTTLYVADTFNHLIRRIVISAGPTATVTTFAGSGSATYAEGTGTAASFNNPTSVGFDASGNILVGDTLNQVVRSITPGGVTSLLAGSPNSSGNANGLALTAARFNIPSGVTGTAAGIFVVDTNNQIVRRIAAATAPSISAQPAATLTVTAGNNAVFTVTASGNPPVSYQWQRSTNSGGSWQNLTNGVEGVSGATSNQLTVAGVTAAMNTHQFRVIVSNGVTPDATSTVATLTVNQAPAITNTSTSFFFTVGQAGTFTLTASGSPAPTFGFSGNFPSWASLNTSTGVVSGTPTDASGSPFNFTVTATNTAGTSSPVAFTITVQTGPAISSHPANQSVLAGQNAAFSVVATSNPAISGYQWERSTNSGGSWFDVSDGGSYTGATSSTLTVVGTTLAMSGDQFRVRVTNAVGTSTSNAATLTVAQAPVFTSTATTTFVVNQANTFTVQASGAPAPTFGFTGTFPSWASLNSSTGVITGTPTDTIGSPYTFTLTATNAGGTANQSFTLNVSLTPLAPAITTQPANQTVGLGQNASFTVVATGNPAPTYQWQRFRLGDPGFIVLTEGNGYSGTNTATLTITNVTTAMSGDLYQVVVTNSNGVATSSQAQLTIALGTVFSTIAGQPGVVGAVDGTGAAARFSAPNAIALDSAGNAYVADAANHVIRKVTSSGVVTTLAGTAGSPGSADGFAADARFNTPSALALDSAGNIYVADAGSHIIRRVTPAGVVVTIAGSAGSIGNADGIGNLARFAFPAGIAVDSFGTIYVADTLSHTIRKITGGNAVTTFVPASAGLSFPSGLAVDSAFNLYVADARNHVIRKVTAGGAVSTLAGLVGTAGSTDGNTSAARFNQPQGVALDATGNVYVADTLNHTLRRIATNGDVTTIAGTALASGSADGGGSTARFNQPYGVAVDTAGNIWVVDTFNHAIRRSGALAAPQITTQPQSRSVFIGDTTTFTVGASGSPTPGFQWQRKAAGTDTFINLQGDSTYVGVNTATLTIVGATLAMSGDEFRAFANNLVEPVATSSSATLTVQPAQVAPTIVAQPTSNVTVNRGDSPSFSVTATGSGTLSYQWRKDGAAINGATSSTYVVPNAQAGSAGLYTVVVSNPFGSVTSSPAALAVNTPPSFTIQPHGETVLVGNPVLFSVGVSGSGVTYQWRKNGQPISGANGPIYAIGSVGASDAGNYDVIVTNSLGSALSSLAQLSVTATPVAPSFTSQPANRTIAVGGTVTLTASAAAAPAASYQWRKNGAAIPGANNATFTLSGIQFGDAGVYDVVATNSVGSVTSSPALLQVIARSYAGTYFGSFANGLGNFALYVRDDNTGVFLGYLPGSTAPVMSLSVAVNNSGQFSFSQSAVAAEAATADGEPARAAALAAVSVSGTIGTDGSVSGSVAGGANASFSASRVPDTGETQGVAGFYQAGATNSGAVAFTIAGANGQAFVVAQSGNVTDGGLGAVNSSGQVAVATGRTTINETITPSTGDIVGSAVGVLNVSLSGASETALATQRLVNISSRARVGSGANVTIAGFVIAGSESKPVLIRTVGPSLGALGVPGTLTNPKLDLYRGETVIATATGIPAANAAAIAAAATQAGAFTLGGGADSAILTTLPPGAYTAIVSSATNNEGVALVEVYDLSAPAAGQKLLNISTRANAGSAENTLIAGVVVTGAVPKRVLIRGVGPGLIPLGLTNVLAQPTLRLVKDGQTVAQNTGYTTSQDANAILTAGAQVGAFSLSAGDSAMIVSLTPGNYTAQVTGPAGVSGIAIIEVYELP